MSDLEILKSKELTLCGNCKRTFNSSNLQPKYLACKHYFCLECIQSGFGKSHGSHTKPNEIYCSNCWKLTDLSEGGAESLDTFEPVLALASCFHKLTTKSVASFSNGINGLETEHSHAERVVNTEICRVHGMPLKLWCINCCDILCHMCAHQEHSDTKSHTLWTDDVAKDEMTKQANNIITATSAIDDHIQQLMLRQRRFLILVRNALAAIEHDVQNNLDNLESQWCIDPGAAEIRKSVLRTEVLLKDAKKPKEVHSLVQQLLTKQNILKEKAQEMIFVCELNDLVGNAMQVFNFDTLRHAVNSIIEGKETAFTAIQQPGPDPILFLANYCMSQLYSRSINVNDNTIAQAGASVSQQFVENLAGIPYQEMSSKLNGHIPFLQNNIPTQEPLPQISASPALPSFTPPPDIADHLSTASSTTPQRCNSPPLIQLQEEQQASPITRTSSAQMYPIESTDSLDLPHLSLIQPQVRIPKMKSLIVTFPRYFFNVEVNGNTKGKFIIETRPDVAPRMCRNFDKLTTNKDGEKSYKGCVFFQCWKGESVITGDFEHNNGRGGKSIYKENFFMPDETRFPAVRGAVGMRRQQKSHENYGLVGSVFRVLLQDMQGFSGIFGHVIDGLEFIDKIASYGDNTGKPSRTIKITGCGKVDSR